MGEALFSVSEENMSSHFYSFQSSNYKDLKVFFSMKGASQKHWPLQYFVFLVQDRVSALLYLIRNKREKQLGPLQIVLNM